MLTCRCIATFTGYYVAIIEKLMLQNNINKQADKHNYPLHMGSTHQGIKNGVLMLHESIKGAIFFNLRCNVEYILGYIIEYIA